MTDDQDEAMRQARRDLVAKYAKSTMPATWRLPAPVWAVLFVGFAFGLYMFNKPVISCEAQHPKDALACTHLETWVHPAPSQPQLEYNRIARWRFNDGI